MKNNDQCFICTEIKDGIKINGKLICLDCEEELVNILPTNPEYDKALNDIKDILFE
ncbi:sigma factor G inhibitor Gin [Selenihalanaerobacter shriftii]|uniref:Inhibitor of sigma-G Gin n=1 Tax=Selenihalanaerobacter shriftii TaxID=142842 RepID=A0A1T4NB45_9FIRM|nr:sigma factor G inhibitor Gin [Selenihalanaerobacter shriftii]SJZ76028.1 Inhibitor of sigma-G Gin [Selenihalanaerobacter shriftii]